MRIVSSESVECLWPPWLGKSEHFPHPRMVSREVVQRGGHVMGESLEILAGRIEFNVGRSPGCEGRWQIQGRRPGRLNSPKAAAGVIQHHRSVDFPVGRVAGNVWCAKRHVVQKIPVDGRFPFPYVHDRSPYCAPGQSLKQGIIIHDFSACRIDQNGRWHHVRKFTFSDQMKRRVGSIERQGDMKGYEVGLYDLGEWPVLSIAGFSRQWRIMKESLHAQCGRLGRHKAADSADTNDPYGFSVEDEAFEVGRHQQGPSARILRRHSHYTRGPPQTRCSERLNTFGQHAQRPWSPFRQIARWCRLTAWH